METTLDLQQNDVTPLFFRRMIPFATPAACPQNVAEYLQRYLGIVVGGVSPLPTHASPYAEAPTSKAIFVDISTSHYENRLPANQNRGSVGAAVQTMWPLLSPQEQGEWERLAEAIGILCSRISELDEKNRRYFQSARDHVAMEEISLLTKELEHVAAMSFHPTESKVQGEQYSN